MLDIKLFTGNANLPLAQSVAQKLDIPLGKAVIGHFSDGEIMVEILESVRGKDVVILQSTCAPVNENLMELIIMADALHRASAASITAMVPYFGYARQDRRVRSRRVPITAKVVADLMAATGIDRVVTVDLHADQIQGFFSIPVDNVYGSNAMVEDIMHKNMHDMVVVSPDTGGVVRARAIAKRLNDAELAIIDKRRPRPNESEIMHIIGDVKGRNCFILDDIVDTAGTLVNAAKALRDMGAASIAAYATHAVLSGKAIENITNSELDEVVVADTIPLRDAAKKCPKIRQVSLSGLLAETIRRIYSQGSVSAMFPEER